MDFSILIAVYKNDTFEFFLDSLKSVCVNQSIKPKQLVLVVDGPISFDIDDAINLIQKDNKDIEVTTIVNEQNLGLAKSLNKGLRLCKYDWVARMDADDISVSNRFEQQIKVIKDTPNVCVVGGWVDEFLDNPNDTISTRVVPADQTKILKMSKSRCPMNHPTVLYKKDLILSVGGYPEDYGKLEDYKLWIDLLKKGYLFFNVQSVLVHMRVGNDFLKRRSNKNEISDWDRLQKYLRMEKMINPLRALLNKILIRIFINMPIWLKRIIYKNNLRN